MAVVTGGAGNLGHDMALALAEAEADVVVTSRALAGRRILAAELEVTSEADIKKLTRFAGTSREPRSGISRERRFPGLPDSRVDVST